MKASLCKLSPCTVARVCDYHAKLFLVAVSSTLKSLLRPHFLNTPDKSPGDRLTEVCTKITDAGGSWPARREQPVPRGCLTPLSVHRAPGAGWAWSSQVGRGVPASTGLTPEGCAVSTGAQRGGGSL